VQLQVNIDPESGPKKPPRRDSAHWLLRDVHGQMISSPMSLFLLNSKVETMAGDSA
jgi:hypothetical protein